MPVKQQQSTVDFLDKYLWNDQTEVVDLLFPSAETDYPHVDRWYEIRHAQREVFANKGAALIDISTHAWVGCPSGVHISDYLMRLLG